MAPLPRQSSSVKIPQVELLRALAMMGIFIFHLWSIVPVTLDAGPLKTLLKNMGLFGVLGVVAFNFTTGFVLALPYLNASAERPPPPYPAFLRRRFRRICPRYYIALALWTIVLLAFPAGRDHPSLVQSFVAHILFVHTMDPNQFFSIVPAYWWLGLLAQFYLAFPPLLKLYRRIQPGSACFIICAACWTVWMLLTRLAAQDPTSPWAMLNYMAYYNLPVRLPEFAIGMWFASVWNRLHIRVNQIHQDMSLGLSFAVLAVAIAIGIVFLATISSVLPELTMPLKHLYLILWCAIGVVALFAWPPISRLGNSRLVTGIAAASFSIYLLHQPILQYLDRWLTGMLSPSHEFLLLLFGAATLSFMLARGLDAFVAQVVEKHL